MSHHSYTASERRGILVIAIISLLLIGAGIGVSFWEGNQGDSNVYPIVEEHPEMIDSLSMSTQGDIDSKESKSVKTKKSREKSVKKSVEKKSPKTYRRRSPLDEPVSN